MWQYKPSDDFDLTQGLDPSSTYDQKLIARGRVQMQTASIILDRLEHSPGLILGDEVGMGKTWIALLTAAAVADAGPVLVLTPSRILANQWRKQYNDLIATKLKPDAAGRREEYENHAEVYEDFAELTKDAKKYGAGIYIASVNAVSPTEYYATLAKTNDLFELLILDEGHNFKNESTLKYQIFKTTRSDRSFKQPLHDKMKRILILTATPFQLGHEELRGVLSIVEATSAPPDLKDQFKQTVESTILNLNRYQSELAKFEHLFHALNPETYAQFKAALDTDQPTDALTTGSPDVNALVTYFDRLRAIKRTLNADLFKFLVRNAKDKSARREVPHAITLESEHQLLFFLTEQLGKIKRRHFPRTEGHAPAIASSFGRFADHLESLRPLENASLAHYRALSDSLFRQHYVNSGHPKMEQIVTQAFTNWMAGEKTLIFCFYIKTLDQFAALLGERIKAFVDEQKAVILRRDDGAFQTFRNNIGTATYTESLVFRDNLFSVSLLPVIEHHGLDPAKFLTVGEDEVPDLVKFLEQINFNPTGANFSKLVAALTHFAFARFHRKHRKLIPDALKDDFEYVLDVDNVRNLFRQQDRRLEEKMEAEERGQRRANIRTYVDNLIADPQRLIAIMTHPTIWSHHAAQLEKLDVHVRAKVTEIISSYLTGDEYLILELLPQFEKRPTPTEIVAAYQIDRGPMGESTYQKVCRFLATGSKMAQDNLDLLAEEMHFRYNRNKTNVEKVIVETVAGGDSNQDKIRTVTAFRTPFPPNILITTSVLAEGVDLHTECRHIVHYDHEWNPAALEQKTGRVDRVGSKAERTSQTIEVGMPYIKHTQDEKAYRVVMARKSWFDTVMGENYQAKWDADEIGRESVFELPERVKTELRMDLDNEAHLRHRKAAGG